MTQPNCDQTQTLKLWQNSKSQIAKNKTKKPEFVTTLKNNDKSLKLNLWQKLKTQLVTTLNNSTCDKNYKKKTISVTKVLKKTARDKTQ